ADHLFGVLARVLFQDPPPVTELRPEAPPELAELISHLLRKDPARRPDSAQAVEATLSALGAIAGDAPGPSMSAAPTLSPMEQRLVQVVFAGSSAVDGRLRDAAACHGAALERVASDPGVAALSGDGPAIDQAASAA